jgi:ABC-type spermidine/putrescine transport system permease subunit II
MTMKSLSERTADALAGLLTFLVLCILYAPVVISGLFSVFDVKDGRIAWDSFSLVHYGELWSNPSVIDALQNTAIVAVLAVFIATVLAVGLALYVEWSGAIARRAVEIAIYLPFLLPPIVTGLSLLVASAQLGVNRGLQTIVIGHMVFVLAVAYRLILTRLQALPRSLIEASADLGANQLQTLRHIVLPHLMSAVATGAVLALTLSFDETLISVFLAGDRMTLPLRLWAMMRVGFTPEINALVTLVLALSLVLAAFAAFRLKIGSQSNVE